MNTLLTKLKKLPKPWPEVDVAKILSEAGLRENKKIAEGFRKTREKFSDTSLFYLALAESFHWAGYAKRDTLLFDLTLRYFGQGDEAIFNNLERLGWRWSELDFERVLRSWSKVIEVIGEDKLPQDNLTAEELVDLQRNYMIWVSHRLYNRKEIKHFGAWLFFAPFKIMAIYRSELWKDEILDNLTMPLGFQVIRGLTALRKGGLEIDERMLKPEEGGFIESVANSTMAMDIQKKLAKLQNTRVIHINTGLHLLGVKKENS